MYTSDGKVITLFLIQVSMYHIVKEVHVQKKPLWLVDLLFQITPSLYREIGTKEDIEKDSITSSPLC